MGRRRGGVATLAAVVCLAVANCAATAPRPTPTPGPTAKVAPDVAALARVAPGLDPVVLALALRASACAARQGMVPLLGVLTVIDYRLPSDQPRLWVLDVTRRTLLHRELVAHGRGSGELFATYFSNEPGSQASSLGLFVTAETYDGRHGRSLRLVGLEFGVNDQALARALVIHGADYVSAEFAETWGRLGRSHGCPALALEVAGPIIDTIGGGTPVFAYHPDPFWLEGSRFLAPCGG